MRLNYKTYPIWEKIENGQTPGISRELANAIEGKVLFEENEDSISAMPRKGNGRLGTWLGSVNVALKAAIEKPPMFLTHPFRSAIKQVIPKLVGGDTKEYMHDAVSPVVIMHEGGGTIVYANSAIEHLKLMLVGFDRNAVVAWATMNTTDFGVGGFGDTEWLKKNYGSGVDWVAPKDNTSKIDLPIDKILLQHFNRDMHHALCDWFTTILVTNFFIKNCEVETKHLATKQKFRTIGEKHLNESKTTIRIMDCTWFTTLVSTTKHNVRGFYRWQPYGPKHSLRKIIWVADFERGGFTKKAKVLNETTKTESI